RGRTTVVVRDDAEGGEPAQVFSCGFRVTVGLLGDRTRSCRFTSSEDRPVDALFDIVTAKRVLERWRVIGGLRVGHTRPCVAADIILTSGNYLQSSARADGSGARFGLSVPGGVVR